MKSYIVNSKPYNEDYVYNILKKYGVTSTSFVYKADFIIAIGGDASMLKVVKYWHQNKLVIPVNTGTLGFLSNDKTLDELLKCYFDNEFLIDYRRLGYLTTKENQGNFKFINEVSVVPLETGKLVSVDLIIDGKNVTTYKGDGLIIATPTGSTAWSLSAGGSIVAPTVECLLVTPNNPFSMNHRPLIVDSNSEITLDGIDKIVIDGNDIVYSNRITISLSNSGVQIVKPHNNSSFYDSIVSKLGWGKNIK